MEETNSTIRMTNARKSILEILDTLPVDEGHTVLFSILNAWMALLIKTSLTADKTIH